MSRRWLRGLLLTGRDKCPRSASISTIKERQIIVTYSDSSDGDGDSDSDRDGDGDSDSDGDSNGDGDGDKNYFIDTYTR